MSVANKQKSSATTVQKNKANIALAALFWGSCLLVALFWNKGTQMDGWSESLPTSFVEAPGTKRARLNLIEFKKRVPRGKFMISMAPGGFNHPEALAIYLSSEWKQESTKTRQLMVQHWSDIWTQVARGTSEGKEHPRISFHQTNNSIYAVYQ